MAPSGVVSIPAPITTLAPLVLTPFLAAHFTFTPLATFAPFAGSPVVTTAVGDGDRCGSRHDGRWRCVHWPCRRINGCGDAQSDGDVDVCRCGWGSTTGRGLVQLSARRPNGSFRILDSEPGSPGLLFARMRRPAFRPNSLFYLDGPMIFIGLRSFGCTDLVEQATAHEHEFGRSVVVVFLLRALKILRQDVSE